MPPRKKTERGRPKTNGSFGLALHLLKNGNHVARQGWNGMWLELHVPDEHSETTLPYVYMSTVGGEIVLWFPSQTDMLADDWHLVDEA
jgi:hypothetical protein